MCVSGGTKNLFTAVAGSAGCPETSQQGRSEGCFHAVEGTLDHLHALECTKWVVV